MGCNKLSDWIESCIHLIPSLTSQPELPFEWFYLDFPVSIQSVMERLNVDAKEKLHWIANRKGESSREMEKQMGKDITFLMIND